MMAEKNLKFSSAEFFRLLQAEVNGSLDITRKTFGEILEHGGSSRKNNILVQTTAGIDGRVLDDSVHNFRKGSQEVRAGNLRVEEDLRSQKALISHVNGEGLRND